MAETPKKRGRPRKDQSVKAAPVPPPRDEPSVRSLKFGLFQITETRPYKIIEGPIHRFGSIKEANKKLEEFRALRKLENKNPYAFVLLPIDGKVGFLPPIK